MADSPASQRHTIRALTSDDVAAYRSLRLASIAECPASVVTTYAAESAVPHASISARLLPTPFQRIFGAFDAASLVGLACFRREPIAVVHDRALIWGVYVAPTARRLGVARALMLAALAHARSFPALQTVSLNVGDSNLAAHTLYRDLGFLPTGTSARAGEARLALQLHHVSVASSGPRP